MRRLLAIAACFIVWVARAEAADPGPVLVGSLRPQGVDKDIAATLSDLLASELARRTTRSVSTEAQVAAVLRAGALAQAAGAEPDAAAAARHLNADYLVSGSVGRIGRVFVLSLDVAGLTKPAGELIAGRQSRWSVVAEGEADTLVAATGQVAEKLAATLTTPEETKAAALGALSKPGSLGLPNSGTSGGGLSGLGLGGSGSGASGGIGGASGGIGGASNRATPPRPATARKTKSSASLDDVGPGQAAPGSQAAPPRKIEVMQKAKPDVKRMAAWKGLAAREMPANELTALSTALKQRMGR
jgi:hypothetical protein